ncbi:MAG: hypothetical protein AAFQ94_18755 [Bacteroidota bacterium]
MQWWTKNEEFLGAINVESINKSIGFNSYSVSRADLQKILLERISELDISIFYKFSAKDISYQDNANSVSFENDTSVNAKIIIGADGRMNSIAYKYVTGNNMPVYQNFVNWVGMIENEQSIFSENKVLDFWGNGERFGIVPINENKGYWAGGKSFPLNSSLKMGNSKKALKRLFGSWSSKINEVIELTKNENIKYRGL